MKQWNPSLRPNGKPRYLELANAIKIDIESGILRGGDRLPSQRSVAQLLGLDFTTVSRGYSEAVKRGYIESFVGRGTFVRESNDDVEDPDPRRALEEDPMMNMPPEPDHPDLVARMTQGLQHVSANLVPLLRYQSVTGSTQDREMAVTRMAENGLNTSFERMAITPGAHASVLAILTFLSDPGQSLLCEAVTYAGIRAIAAQLGLRLIGDEMDEHGILPDALERSIAEHYPSALYLNPTLQNPTTHTVPAERREKIAQILCAHDIPVVGDDACCFVASSAPPPISHLTPKLGWHVAGLSKCFGAGLRLALTTVPEGQNKGLFYQALRTGNVMTSPISTALMSRWIKDGTASALQTHIRNAANERQKLASELLEGCVFRGQPDAFNIWLDLPEGTTRAEVMARMTNRQIGIMPSDAFSISAPPTEAFRVCLGGPITTSQLVEDLRALRDAIVNRGWMG